MTIQKKRLQKELRKEQHRFVEVLPEALTPIHPSEFPRMQPLPVKAWKSRMYLVQLYDEGMGAYRMSVCRTKLNPRGRWQDGLTWDELQTLKREIGFGDLYAVEVYPRDVDMVNVANFRHLWIMPAPLPIGWFKK